MPKAFEVRFDDEAERDLEAIGDYVASRSSTDRALDLIYAIRAKAELLTTFPQRGAVPKELDRLGVHRYRQTLLGAYRIFYELTDDAVVILLIADGRRDMEALLSARLIGRPPLA